MVVCPCNSMLIFMLHVTHIFTNQRYMRVCVCVVTFIKVKELHLCAREELTKRELPGKTVHFPFQFWYCNLYVAVTTKKHRLLGSPGICSFKNPGLHYVIRGVIWTNVRRSPVTYLPCLKMLPTPKLDFDLIDRNGSRGTIEPLLSII